jgi:hypothetical protein
VQRKLKFTTSKSRRKKPLPRLHQQIIIISHPNHLPTPSSPPPRQTIQGRDVWDPTTPQPALFISVEKNHSERKREIMKQGKEIRQTKTGSSKYKTRSRVKRCQGRQSFSPSTILCAYAPRSANGMPCFVLSRVETEYINARKRRTRRTRPETAEQI